MSTIVGAGRAVRDLAASVNCAEALTLGRPKMLRGLSMDDSYGHERKMTWSELFFDLIFVTGVRAMGDSMRAGLLKEEDDAAPSAEEEEEEESITMFQYVWLFLALWALWYDQTNYGTRWGANDVWNFLHFGLYMMGVISYVVAIAHLEQQWGRQGLFVAVGFCYAVEVASQLRVLLYFAAPTGHNWRVRQYALTELAHGAVRLGLCAWGYGAAGSAHWLSPLIGLSLIPHVKIAVVIIGRRISTRYFGWIPLHIEHYSERLSLLMIIYLGDGVDNLAGRTHLFRRPPLDFDIGSLGQFALGFLLLLGLKLLLLDSCEVDVERHAIRRAVWSTAVFNWSMPLQAFGLAFTSSGLALLLGATDAAAPRAVWGTELLCDGVAFVLLAFVLVELAHKPPERPEPTASCEPLIHHHHALLLHAYHLQIGLNLVALAFCVATPRLGALRGAPATLLAVLNALVFLAGAPRHT